MEIRVEERLTGRELKERILARYGSEEALRRLARRKRSGQVGSDLLDLEALAEHPDRLDEEMRITTIGELTPKDLEALTPARLHLLNRLAEATAPLNVTALAKALRRDKKNVSEDLRVLQRLGLVAMARSGRQSFPSALPREIHIILDRVR